MAPPPVDESLALKPLIRPSQIVEAVRAREAELEEIPEIWSMRLSMLGATLSLPALTLLFVPAITARSPAHIFSFTVYAIGLLSMFIASAAFHAKAGQERLFLKNVDYCAIGLMIAGNFTPFCAIALRTTYSSYILASVWALALFAITLRISRPHLSKWVFIIAYTAIGWIGMLVAYPLWGVLGVGGTVLTLLGGVFYTVGTLVFNRNLDDVEPPGFGPHDIWHLFILAGTGCHFLVVWFYMLPA